MHSLPYENDSRRQATESFDNVTVSDASNCNTSHHEVANSDIEINIETNESDEVVSDETSDTVGSVSQDSNDVLIPGMLTIDLPIDSHTSIGESIDDRVVSVKLTGTILQGLNTN